MDKKQILKSILAHIAKNELDSAKALSKEYFILNSREIFQKQMEQSNNIDIAPEDEKE